MYDHRKIEEKWQQFWEAKGLFQDSAKLEHTRKLSARSHDDQAGNDTVYLLFAFAYPSGSGLHVGHVESKTALDIMARFYRMRGKHVFFPVGWDAFGLPAENFAIKTGTPPTVTTKEAIHTFRRQIKRIGISYDWANEIATNHPEYYRWTQWIFAKLYSKGLAYRGTGMVNWCPSCQTVLANEQVVEGKCERCGTAVIQKEMEQWFFKITQYRDELISGLDNVDWPTPTKQQQLNWIGKATGLNIDFSLEKGGQKLTVWTKFWETVFGVTYLVIAPEKFTELHLIEQVTSERKQDVLAYLDAASHKTEEERKIGEKDKTGVDTGLTVVNPVNGTVVPLYVADYVLASVGTGVVMGVPAHDSRDFDFAKKHNLEIVQVVSYDDAELNTKVAAGKISHDGEGALVNSGEFDGLSAGLEGKEKMASWMIEKGFGSWNTTYKLRDWLISRQRYWGAPIPIVYDPNGTPHLIEADDLPWELPTDVDFNPTGESPLRSSQEFVARAERYAKEHFADLIKENGWNADGKGWVPEFDTMDTFVDSSWYFMRYVDSRNSGVFASAEQLKTWLPVDFYMIGPEHIVLHLLYSRFFTKFLRDEGYFQFDEPFMKMRHQGMILGPDGRKMSKSKGNVINPDEVIEKFGADTLRMYEMFMGPIEADKPWNTTAVAGVFRFLQKLERLFMEELAVLEKSETSEISDVDRGSAVRRKLHQTIQKVTKDIPLLKFNTAIASLMEFGNIWDEARRKPGTDSRDAAVSILTSSELESVALLLAPFTPFLAEELWQSWRSVVGISENGEKLKNPENGAEGLSVHDSVHTGVWPHYDAELARAESVEIPVQVNGKVRAKLQVSAADIEKHQTVVASALEHPDVQRFIGEKKLIKQIYIAGRIVNLVTQ